MSGRVYVPKLKALNIYDMAKYLYGEDNIVVTGCDHTEKTHESLKGGYVSKDYVVNPSDLL